MDRYTDQHTHGGMRGREARVGEKQRRDIRYDRHPNEMIEFSAMMKSKLDAILQRVVQLSSLQRVGAKLLFA